MLKQPSLAGLILATTFVVCACFEMEPSTAIAPKQDSSQDSEPGQSQSAAVASRPKRIRATVEHAVLVYKVDPVYPEDARRAHVMGTVVLHAIIARDGSIQGLEVVSGPPVLVDAAMDAVRQWRYQPTLLNGEPLEVDTKISVVFELSKRELPVE